jgi:hypothetical protein
VNTAKEVVIWKKLVITSMVSQHTGKRMKRKLMATRGIIVLEK